MKHILLPCGAYWHDPRHICTQDFHGLPPSYLHKFHLLKKKTDISVAVPLFGSMFAGIYGPQI